MYSHTCIKQNCAIVYQDEDPDAYYCPSCEEEKKQVAATLDAKFNTVGQQPSGMLAAYDAACAGKKFPTAAALGIKL